MTVKKKSPAKPDRILKYDPEPHTGAPERSRSIASKYDEALEEVREVRHASASRNLHSHAEVHATVADVEGRDIDVHTVDGRVFIDTHGEKVLDQDGIVALRKKLEMSFQAVA